MYGNLSWGLPAYPTDTTSDDRYEIGKKMRYFVNKHTLRIKVRYKPDQQLTFLSKHASHILKDEP